MSIYDHLTPLIRQIKTKNPSYGSRRVAKKLIELHPDLDFEKIARYIRSKHGKPNKLNFYKQTPSKVLIFDIETAPIIAYTWSKWPNAIPDNHIIQDWFIICWSAKWLFDDAIYSSCVTSKEAQKGNDKRVVKALWQMFEEADIIIAHNLDKFDHKRANTRFLKYGLGLPTPFQTIDTLRHARKKFAITSNRLDYIAKDFLNIEGKLSTSKDLWRKAIEGCKESLNEMQTYCDQDVRVLEEVYLHLRPYIQPHPNIGLQIATNTQCCPSCGSTDIVLKGTYRTYISEYESFRCNSCQSIGRLRKNNTPKEVKDRLTVSTPK